MVSSYDLICGQLHFLSLRPCSGFGRFQVVQKFVLQEHPSLARLERVQLARRGAFAQRRWRHGKEASSVVQAYCRIINDHVQPCGSGRSGASCHSLRIIAEVSKKTSVSFARNCGETRTALACCSHNCHNGPMEDDGAAKEEAPQPNRVNPRDGLIDFTPYSIEQLRELQYS